MVNKISNIIPTKAFVHSSNRARPGKGKSGSESVIATEVPPVTDTRDRWVAMLPRLPRLRADHKTGRNDPCPCGSGKKFKNCCHE